MLSLNLSGSNLNSDSSKDQAKGNYFSLPTKYGPVEIGVDEYGLDLFPEDLKGEKGTLENAELQEGEAIAYLEKTGIRKERWERDNGGTGLLEIGWDDDEKDRGEREKLLKVLEAELKEVPCTPV